MRVYFPPRYTALWLNPLASSLAEWTAGAVTTKFLDTFPYSLSCIEVIDGGLSTTVQDGRPRLPSGGDGIPRGGPMDELAAKAANILVGNAPECETFEIVISCVPFSPLCPSA